MREIFEINSPLTSLSRVDWEGVSSFIHTTHMIANDPILASKMTPLSSIENRLVFF